MSADVQARVSPRKPVIHVTVTKPSEIPAQLVPVLFGGGGESSTFTWNQTLALAVWTVPHNLRRYPAVTVVDTLGNVVAPDMRYVDNNIVQITHGTALAGKAYLN
jgi:hypothetical protein